MRMLISVSESNSSGNVSKLWVFLMTSIFSRRKVSHASQTRARGYTYLNPFYSFSISKKA